MAGNVQYNLGTMRNPPSWSVGDGENTVSLRDIEDALDTIPDRPYYTLVVTGYYSQIYPGKENEDQISLSFPMDTESLLDGLEDENMDDATDYINSFLPDFSLGYWEDVNKVYFLDRPPF